MRFLTRSGQIGGGIQGGIFNKRIMARNMQVPLSARAFSTECGQCESIDVLPSHVNRDAHVKRRLLMNTVKDVAKFTGDGRISRNLEISDQEYYRKKPIEYGNILIDTIRLSEDPNGNLENQIPYIKYRASVEQITQK